MLKIKRIIHIIKMLKKALDVKTIEEVEIALMKFYGEIGILEETNEHKTDIKEIYERLNEIQYLLKFTYSKKKIRRKVKEVMAMIEKLED